MPLRINMKQNLTTRLINMELEVIATSTLANLDMLDVHIHSLFQSLIFSYIELIYLTLK